MARKKQAAPRRAPRKSNPALKNTAAAIAGGVGGALVGGLLVRGGVKPTTAAVAMTVAGGVGAATLKGASRLAAGGVAAAGGGQLALAWLSKQQEQANEEKLKDVADKIQGGGERNALPQGVHDAFERARQQMRMSQDNDDQGDDGPDVIIVDQAA